MKAVILARVSTEEQITEGKSIPAQLEVVSCSKKTRNDGLLALIALGKTELSRAGIEEAREECELILMKLLGCARSDLYLKEYELANSGVRTRFLTILEKRAQRIPLAYLLKEADFWRETLYVDERCLIPRPETEILVETAIRKMKASERVKSLRPRVPSGLATTDSFSARERVFSFLDIGTGSGAIAVAILRACGNARGTLLDVSAGALEVAKINLEKYGLQERATLVQGDLFRPFSQDEKWNLIVSNPPYLSEKDWAKIQEELKFEPKKALDGGKDGLDYYREIVHGAKSHLTSGGLLALETGLGQADRVSAWLQTAGYDNIQRFRDHSGIERVVIAQTENA